MGMGMGLHVLYWEEAQRLLRSGKRRLDSSLSVSMNKTAAHPLRHLSTTFIEPNHHQIDPPNHQTTIRHNQKTRSKE